MKKITKSQALALLKQAVDERGEDYIYPGAGRDSAPSCQYVVNKKPACIVGLALNKGGVGIKRLAPNASQNQKPLFTRLDLLERMTDNAYEVFASAQDIQDCGGTWGRAYEEALSVAEVLPDVE